MKGQRGGILLCLASVLWAQAAGAEGGALSDPTRPPNASLAVEAGEGGAASAQLQSVLIAPGRTFAVINGETVRLGARYGEARVIRITEAVVVLRYSDRDETLELLPGIQKQTRDRRAMARTVPSKK